MLISLIVAMTPDRLIGAAGRLPWHMPEDLKRFKQLTLGHALIMGRKTYASIGRPLPGRRNLIITHNPAPPAIAGVEWFTSLESALTSAQTAGETECFIAGGAQIYAQALLLAHRLYITYVQEGDGTFHGDTYFPAWDHSQWRTLRREPAPNMEFVTYERLTTNH